jgi:hypothetical protein
LNRARDDVVRRGRVVVVFVGEGSNERELVGACGQFGEVFAKSHAWEFRRDAGKVAANFGGRVRFGVEGLELARGAREEHHQYGFGFPRRRTCWGEASEAETQEARVPNLQQFASRDANGRHDDPSKRDGSAAQSVVAWDTLICNSDARALATDIASMGKDSVRNSLQ